MIEPNTPASPQSPTRAEMYAALHDDTTPIPVKRFLRETLYGQANGRREERSRLIRRLRGSLHTNVLAEKTDSVGKNLKYQMGYLTSNKPKRPAGMNTKQWQAVRRAVRLEVKARHAVGV